MNRLSLFVATLMGLQVNAWAVSFADSSFSNSLWSGQKVADLSTPSTTFSADYRTDFGGRTDVRLVSHTFGPLDPTRSDIYSFHGLSTTSYDPAILGALGSVSISFDVNSAMGGTSGGVLRVAAILQGGTVYRADTFSGIAFAGSGWSAYNAPGIVASGFTSAALTNPDFSASGVPIFFGFLLGNGSSLGVSTSTQTYVDNFSAVATPIPEPSAAALALGLAALGAAAGRRFRR